MKIKPFFPERDDLFYPVQAFFDKFYNELISDTGLSSIKAKTGYPRWDIYENKDEYIIEVSVPGLTDQDLQLEILPEPGTEARILKLAGKMNAVHQVNDAKYYIKELRRSTFERYCKLPNYVKGDPKAILENGILILSWKIEKENFSPKTIPITVKRPLPDN